MSEIRKKLTTEIEILMLVAFSVCPTEVRDTSNIDNFIYAIKDEETQKATRLIETKYLKASLLFAIKFEISLNLMENLLYANSKSLISGEA
ncbi:hypothetical protein NPIL_509091 [Nephila pilipes]|uniref:Uncharacterized protein n=1 Tax=Nephila pilipes TaxID=299642 RepID=A0A8X6N582_NEPPI|nr:hypothetical protein NPIL_509091 [Nephila pilipes]